MAKTKPKKAVEEAVSAALIDEENHPDYIPGRITTAEPEDSLTPIPGDPIPGIPIDFQPTFPLPHPVLPPFPIPQYCSPVSGRYKFVQPLHFRPQLPSQPIQPMKGTNGISTPIIPFNFQHVTVRVDVDRFYPQQRISIEVSRIIPRNSAHVIAEVVSDKCSGFNHRTITANIVYRDGSADLIPGSQIIFKATSKNSFRYSNYSIELLADGKSIKQYDLAFESRYFDRIEFEVDRVDDAGSIVTSHETHSHPDRPSNLPDETITLASVYQRAGFEVSMSSNTSVIPNTLTGSNNKWSDSEMHNAMVTYWSQFADRPQWAMWVLYARQHDSGRSLGGVMFDDIGPNHRQGTAIFTDSFIKDPPPGESHPDAWKKRMEFWTAVHEMGHAYNLAHSWQKALGRPDGAPGDPWIPLANDPDSLSFMNYPFRFPGGESSFFENFEFRFSDDELAFMRHAPRRFVKMGDSNWFNNHNFEAPQAVLNSGSWDLQIRPNRESNTFRFLEPVMLELKLKNTSDKPVPIEVDLLEDGSHFKLFIGREGGNTLEWKPLITQCHKHEPKTLNSNEAIYGSHMVNITGAGWTIAEPGFYKLQAAIDMGDEIVMSNVLRLYVAPPVDSSESAIAPDYFTEDVGRVLAFRGAPVFVDAENVLSELVSTCSDNPACHHASLALHSPKLGNYKVLNTGAGRDEMEIKTNSKMSKEAVNGVSDSLLQNADAAADTMGHISYFDELRSLTDTLEESGNQKSAKKILIHTIKMMKERNILGSVVDNAEARLKRRSKDIEQRAVSKKRPEAVAEY